MSGIWGTYFAGKRAGLCHRRYVVLVGFADTLKIPTEVPNVLERSAWLPVESLHTMLDVVMSTSPGVEVPKKKKNRNLWNLIVKHGVESMDKINRDEGTTRYSIIKKLLSQYVLGDSGRV